MKNRGRFTESNQPYRKPSLAIQAEQKRVEKEQKANEPKPTHTSSGQFAKGGTHHWRITRDEHVGKSVTGPSSAEDFLALTVGDLDDLEGEVKPRFAPGDELDEGGAHHPLRGAPMEGRKTYTGPLVGGMQEGKPEGGAQDLSEGLKTFMGTAWGAIPTVDRQKVEPVQWEDVQQKLICPLHLRKELLERLGSMDPRIYNMGLEQVGSLYIVIGERCDSVDFKPPSETTTHAFRESKMGQAAFHVPNECVLVVTLQVEVSFCFFFFFFFVFFVFCWGVGGGGGGGRPARR
jgi:hypothetical protein